MKKSLIVFSLLFVLLSVNVLAVTCVKDDGSTGNNLPNSLYVLIRGHICALTQCNPETGFDYCSVENGNILNEWYCDIDGSAKTYQYSCSWINRICRDGKCCSLTTCAAQNKDCGTISDGCGGTLDCGSCSSPETCGGTGVDNVCGYIPPACSFDLTSCTSWSTCTSGSQYCIADNCAALTRSCCTSTTEICDGIDNDCDSSIDEEVKIIYYRDIDGDSYGSSTSTQACSQPSGYVTNSNDNCDNNVYAWTNRNVYVDIDHDGYTTASTSTSVCVGQVFLINERFYYKKDASNYKYIESSLGVDCNDNDALITLCTPQTQTCIQAGGNCCLEGQTCSNPISGVSDCSLCCPSSEICTVPFLIEDCDDNTDNDGDNLIDCDDSDCSTEDICDCSLLEEGDCNNDYNRECYWGYDETLGDNICEDCASGPTCYDFIGNCENNNCGIPFCELSGTSCILNSNCLLDSDLDGICDDIPDNCINIYNPLQEDCDGDGIGNACDPCETGNTQCTFEMEKCVNCLDPTETVCTQIVDQPNVLCEDIEGTVCAAEQECIGGFFILSSDSATGKCCMLGTCGVESFNLAGVGSYELAAGECMDANEEGIGTRLMIRQYSDSTPAESYQEPCSILPKQKQVPFFSIFSLVSIVFILTSFYFFRKKLF